MSFQTEIMLAETNHGLMIMEINEKETLLPKNHIAFEYEQKIRQAINDEDSALMAQIVAELYVIANQLGFANAPGGYLMKHNGFILGKGLITRSGIRSDITFTFRTKTSVLRK